MKYKVKFSVDFITEVDCLPHDLPDTLANIDIPENATCKYVGDSFDIYEIVDEAGEDCEL